MVHYQLRALLSSLKTSYGLHLYLAERCCENLQSARGPARCKSDPAISWLVSETIYCTIFQQQFSNSPPPRQFFAQNTFKKHQPWKMLNEQIIELQLRGPGPPSLTCISITGYFHDKTKISNENLRVGFHLQLKCCTRQCTLFPPTCTKSSTIKL